MTTTLDTRQQCLDAALAWASEFRSNLKELPQGERWMAGRCPLAVATGLHVDTVTACDDHGGTYPLPLHVAEFVERFDRGEFPDLIAE